LASVGTYNVPVKELPRLAICSTGNELVEVNEQPLLHQIRKSNSYMLATALAQEGITASLHHFTDDEVEMTTGLCEIINDNDVVLLSGAVSKGKYDYLPSILAQLGMRTIFHGIAQRPGKPMLFGIFPTGTLVFGFPGNPMSTFVCYQMYFRAWLRSCLQIKQQIVPATLGKTIAFMPNLSYHVPVLIQNVDGVMSAMPVPGNNSGDIPSLANVEGLITLQQEKSIFEEGMHVNVVIC
jgi:molybdopterin molybdotransferase